jgi:hypothetical protein
MELILQREKRSPEWTQGKLYVDEVFECFTLEDQAQVKKVMHETCISAQRYEIVLRTTGGHHEKYLKKFPLLHRGMLWIINVPGFQFVLIHIGNDDDDSSGCVLVGQSFKDGKLAMSTVAYLQLYKKVIKAFDKGEKVFITIKD